MIARGPRPRTKRHFDLTRQRLRELERVIEWRGATLDTDDADLYLLPVARCHLRILHKKFGCVSAKALLDRLRFWANERRLVLSDQLVHSVAHEALEHPAPEKADALGVRLRLSDGDRHALKIRTIGACDADRAERARRAKERKRVRERERSAEKRRAAKAKPREIWLAESLARTQPWLAEGVAKRTWYRRRRARGVGTGPLPHGGTGPLPHGGTGMSLHNSFTGERSTRANVPAAPARGAGNPRAPQRQAEPRDQASGGSSRLASAPSQGAVASEPPRQERYSNEKRHRRRKPRADGKPTAPPYCTWVGNVLYCDLRVAGRHIRRSLFTGDVAIGFQRVMVQREQLVADAYYGGIGKPGPRLVDVSRRGECPKGCYWLRGSFWTEKTIRGRCYQRSLRTTDAEIAAARRDYVHAQLLAQHGPAGRSGPRRRAK